MAKYEIELTDTEDKAMTYIVDGNLGWISHAAKNRARIAKEEIISLNTAHCNKNSIAIAVGEDAQVTQAYTLGIVKTAADLNKETSLKTLI